METLTQIFSQITDPDAVFRALMPALCDVLNCDRCFLYIRNPETLAAEISHCYGRSPEFPDLTGARSIESPDIATQDPLMAIAFRTPEAVFVDDIETASPDLLDLDYEQQHFGHRALIHAPIYWQGKLYGILEPCVFGEPRHWTETDRAITAWTQEKIAPLVVKYLHGVSHSLPDSSTVNN